MAKGVGIIGGGVQAAQCALALAGMGVEAKVIAPSLSLGFDSASAEEIHLWPLMLRAASHPLVTLYTNCKVKSVAGKPGKFVIKALKEPRYVSEELCTACGRCEAECSVKVYSKQNGRMVAHSAIHAPVPGANGAPSAFRIEKNGVSPCRVSCPLGINVQGFTSLIAKGKVDKALAMITESAPLPAVLGRLCTHPCESKCSRGKVDEPLFIQSLHRYAADKAPGGIQYRRKNPAGSRKEKIAIVGSGPAGLACGWELARRGYSLTIFEAHGVIGGMLATGIPRFRLPREVREREVEAIKALGVDIKSGVTVGRDVMYSDLIERGYRAFFIGVGAQQNNKLNIPGEDLEGVVDSMSLLFTLNLKVGAVVGANVVLIGGGNSAVDCARTAKRRSKGEVRILCITKEMTAIKEDVDEAIKEGVLIDYMVSPVEILGDGNRVTGIKCQKLKKVEFTPEGIPIMEPVPDSEFSIKADHVVVSVGQKPNTPALNIRGLELRNNNTITVDPLTMETNIPGLFAGGDCVTGSNNVVSAIAAGLQAAESIDRYLRGHDIRKGRSLEKPQPAEVDIKERKASPYRRASMSSIPLSKRRGSFEETNLGLPEKLAKREAERCLNCALCSECKECEQICEPGAVFHGDTERQIEIEAERIINFIQGNGTRQINRDGVYNVIARDGGLTNQLAQASAAAVEAAIALRPEVEERPSVTKASGSCPETQPFQSAPPVSTEPRMGVFLCRCGESISSVIDFAEVTRQIARLPGVYKVWDISQTCREEGSYEIAQHVAQEKLDRVVLAACRCCNLEQVCFSCTDRRVLCRRYLDVNLPPGTAVEFVNIREQCAWVHRDDPAGATSKAIDLISAGLARASRPAPVAYTERPIEGRALVIGTGSGAAAAARDLAALGHSVTLVADLDKARAGKKNIPGPVKEFKELKLDCYPLPGTLDLTGVPGNYEAVLKYDSQVSRIKAGAVILDLTTTSKNKPSPLGAVACGSLIGRILTHRNGCAGCAAARDFSVKETAGIFIIMPEKSLAPEQQVRLGAATAARAAAYLRQNTVSPRAQAVSINAKLCRGCGDCALVCPYIEMKVNGQGTASASIDPALCYGCGACVALCPTGAITQPVQSEAETVSTLEAMLAKANRAGEMNIVVFACNWDGLSCVEAAAQEKLSYPTSVRVVRMPCLSRVHAGLILKAFELGAGGVMLLGCKPGECHYNSSPDVIKEQYEKARGVLGLLGVEADRLVIADLSAGDGSGFVKSVTSFIHDVERMRARSLARSGAV